MNSKRVGAILVLITLILSIVLYNYLGKLEREGINIGCFTDEECARIQSQINITHFIFGLMGAIFSLGIYLLIFAKGEEAILRRLEEDKNKSLEKEKFNILRKALNEKEAMILEIVRNQEGIKQNTLRIKADLSKAKLSQILTSLEKRGLIKKVRTNKTYSIYLNRDI